VVSSLRAYPNYLPYSNELWGGPGKTYKVLTDSSVDWGQGLKAAKRYVDEHHIDDCWLAYFGTVSPRHYDIPCRMLPTAFGGVWSSTIDIVPETIQGTLLVSASEMSGQFYGPEELNPYGQFLRAKPQTDIAGCILVYKGSFDGRPLAAMTHVAKAWEFVQGGKLEPALSEAQRALALQPHDPWTYVLLGEIHKQRKQTAEARQMYQRAIALARSIAPEHFPYLYEYVQKELNGL
jgi:tetratricopeptide (TPR) repeat protein